MAKVYTAKEAARILRVSLVTLGKIDKTLRPARTPGGHRRYTRKMLEEYLKGSKKK